MWNSIKIYLHFCRLAFKERFPTGRYGLLKKVVWPLLVFSIAWVLGAYFGIPLRSLAMPVYSLLPGTMWIVVILLFVVAFLLFLIEGARRFNERTIMEIYQANEPCLLKITHKGGYNSLSPCDIRRHLFSC